MLKVNVKRLQLYGYNIKRIEIMLSAEFLFNLNLTVSEAHITLCSRICLHALSTTGRAPL